MSTFAILGATGSTGGSILQILSQNTQHGVHALVRSKAKLQKQNPAAINNSRVHVFEGSISNQENLIACLTGVQAVFLTVAVMDNIPGCTIAQDTAQAVINALEHIQTHRPDLKLPRLIVLSSASFDPVLSRDISKLFLRFLLAASSYAVNDLKLAEAYLRTQAKRLGVEVTFVKPGGLVHDTPKGHELNTERQQTFLSFLDLAGGMIEVAEEKTDKWDGVNMSVVPKSKARIEWRNGWYLMKGLLFHVFPGLYPYLGS